MPDSQPRWSLADTHCVWCGRKKATQEDNDRDCIDDLDHDEECWCTKLCWYSWTGFCNEASDPEATAASLRATVEAQGKVIERAREIARRIKVSQDFSDYMVLIKDLLDLLSPSKVINEEADDG